MNYSSQRSRARFQSNVVPIRRTGIYTISIVCRVATHMYEQRCSYEIQCFERAILPGRLMINGWGPGHQVTRKHEVAFGLKLLAV
jgi:hypothetical protein